MIDFLTDGEIYKRVILKEIEKTQSFLWLATADLKDLHVKTGRKFVPLLERISSFLERGISVRLIHAKEPGPHFRESFDKYPVLAERLERLLCRRVHFKSIVIDGKYAYSGSANLTGAGMGARSDGKRNFESGVFTDDKVLVSGIMGQYDRIWMGSFCSDCRFVSDCPEKSIMI